MKNMSKRKQFKMADFIQNPRGARPPGKLPATRDILLAADHKRLEEKRDQEKAKQVTFLRK